jgi:aminoglycoside phosphotransferase (APT) family kinase protein
MKRDDVSAIEVSQVPGGFSKDTIFFTIIDAQAPAQKLVIRKDLQVPLIDKSVINEFDLLTRLHALRFPVAEPLWLETEADIFAGAFIVSRRVAGTSDAAKWTGDRTRARIACEQLAQILAQLHGYSPVDLGIDAQRAGLSAGVHMEREIANWTRLFHRRRQEAFPLQEMPLVWLSANIPAALYDRPARVVHGDVGFHNLMFDDAGQMTALLDWEFSVMGDPTQDLCFVRQFIEPLMPWSEFLAVYRDAGGEPPCVEAEFFYKLWTKTRNAVGCVDAQTLFDTVMPTEMRFALAGYVFAPYMFVDQCQTLIEHLAGTGGP